MKTAPAILPKNLKILNILGEHIQLARLRRKFSAEQVAERAGISRKTVYNIEQGIPTVAIGSYLQVLFVLGLEKDLSMVASTDPLGRKLQDAGITTAKRAPKKSNKSPFLLPVVQWAKNEEAEKIINDMRREIAKWRTVAKKVGISSSEIEQTKRAFRDAEMKK